MKLDRLEQSEVETRSFHSLLILQELDNKTCDLSKQDRPSKKVDYSVRHASDGCDRRSPVEEAAVNRWSEAVNPSWTAPGLAVIRARSASE
jgi:hypothetical protein